MKILMTADTVGGVFAYALELSRALARHGVEVMLATNGRLLSSEQWRQARRVPGLEVFESSDRPEWMEDPWDDVARSSAWLLDLEAQVHPDVVHLNDYAHGALPFAAPKLIVGHSCIFSWFEAVRREPPPPSFDRYRAEVARGLAGAGLVVAPTRWMLDQLARHYGPLPRSRVIPHGRSPGPEQPGEKEPMILCAARLRDEARTAQLLDRVAGSLAWPVLLASEEEQPLPAEACARPGGGARPLGLLSAEALSCFYHRAALFALPARYDPFDLSVLEAALAGCALVLGDTPSLREQWEGAALFVDPDDPELLRRILSELTERSGARSTLGELARARARMCSPERMAEGYLAAYRELRVPLGPSLETAALEP